MASLIWDNIGERLYETGVSHGVLYPLSDEGEYDLGVAWNGLTTVTESPSGADATATYADNIKYLSLIAQELFGGTIEAYTYPDEFAKCDGTVISDGGVRVGQQRRKTFGFCYRTLLGDDIEGTDRGFKLHMIYGCTAAPSEKAYASVNESPEAIALSWAVSTIPVPVTVQIDGKDVKPTSLITLDSTEVDSATMDDLLDILYGTDSVDPRLPLPDEVITMFEGTVTEIRLVGAGNVPTYNTGTHVVTIPSVAHITWKINGVEVATGAQTAMDTGESSVITAHADAGYRITGDDDWTFDY